MCPTDNLNLWSRRWGAACWSSERAWLNANPDYPWISLLKVYIGAIGFERPTDPHYGPILDWVLNEESRSYVAPTCRVLDISSAVLLMENHSNWTQQVPNGSMDYKTRAKVIVKRPVIESAVHLSDAAINFGHFNTWKPSFSCSCFECGFDLSSKYYHESYLHGLHLRDTAIIMRESKSPRCWIFMCRLSRVISPFIEKLRTQAIFTTDCPKEEFAMNWWHLNRIMACCSIKKYFSIPNTE